VGAQGAIVALAVPAPGEDLAVLADLVGRAELADLAVPDMATSSATIVQAGATATAAKAAGKRHALAPDGCFPAPRTTAVSMPRMPTQLARPQPIVAHREIAAHRGIVARRGSRVLTTVAHGRPWGQVVQQVLSVQQMQQMIVPPLAHGRTALQARGRIQEARVGDRPLARVRQMPAQGLDLGRRAMAGAALVLVPGGRRVAAAGQALAEVAGVTTGTGPVPVAVVGMSQRCRKSRIFRRWQGRTSRRPCRQLRQARQLSKCRRPRHLSRPNPLGPKPARSHPPTANLSTGSREFGFG